ncbi:exonuclease 1-like isoform X2 [Ptychodera flava]|uniref:exonuclease 1-like isoform X2 n=1 Tax=Ptychodera flava TaxID=63121 RepID=UPI00396A77C6
MGIQGLLPFLKDATEQTNIKKYAGYTVAVDTYCWLHKGAFACAMQLAKGEETDQYVRYVLKYVNMLLSMKVKPILVFDGRNLASKEGVEKARRQRRETNHAKGKQFLREGKVSEARDCFTKCINITSKMASDVMKAARSLGVDCIVAPYEADAQLAYLNRIGIAQCVITEDSDLTAFGCDKVMFKMDLNGNGLEIDKSKFSQVMKMGGRYDFDKFRYMCILAGCDYLASLPNIGLKKAWKVFHLATTPDVTQVLKRLGQYLKTNLVVPKEYIDGFIRANNTFLYQLAFDPIQRKVVPLHPYPEGINPQDLEYAGEHLPDKLALQLSLGNLDVHSMQSMDNYTPNSHQPVKKDTASHLLSVWHKDYKPLGKHSVKNTETETRPSTKGKEVAVKSTPWKSSNKPERKVLPQTANREMENEAIHDDELKSQYKPVMKKKSVSPSSDDQNGNKKISPSPQRKILNKFATKRMTSERRQELLQENNTETSRFFVSSGNKASDSDSAEKPRMKSELYSAMVEYDKQDHVNGEIQDDDESTTDPETCKVGEEKIHRTLRDKFEYKSSSKLLKDRETSDSVQNRCVENGDADSEMRDTQSEMEVLKLKHCDNSVSETKVADSCVNGIVVSEKNGQHSSKSSGFQRLNHFRWNQSVQAKFNLDKKQTSSCDTTLVSMLTNSPSVNGQFKSVKMSKSTDMDEDNVDRGDQVIAGVKGHSGNDVINDNDSLCDSNSPIKTVNVKNTSTSVLPQGLSRETLTDKVYVEIDDDDDDDDDAFICSQSSLNSSQSSMKGTRCSGLSAKIATSNKQGSKNLPNKCKMSGLSKKTRKRKSSDENTQHSKQLKLTDMFSPKQSIEKSKTKGLPMSPIKDSNSHNIARGPVTALHL